MRFFSSTLASLFAMVVGCSSSSNTNPSGSGGNGGGNGGTAMSNGGMHAGTGGSPSSDGGMGGGVGGTGGDSPSVPAELLLTAQDTGTTTLVWQAATSPNSKIDHYRIYRNDAAYATTNGLTYKDAAATDCEVRNLDAPATAYFYAVSAVDAKGNEGPKTTQYAAWGFRGAKGGSAWGAGDYSYGLTSRDWSDTSGDPVGGGNDVKLVFANQMGGGFQPYSGMPESPTWALEAGAFKYFTIDIKAEHGKSNNFFISMLSRLPFGDVYNWVDVRVNTYANLTDNAWTTVKIPLKDFHFSTSQFTGSIGAPYGIANGLPYATLKVASLDSGTGVDNGGFVLGSGLQGAVYVIANSQNASVGTFQIQGAGITAQTTVASKSMSYQRSEFYKFDLGLNDGMPGGTVYLNNFGFSRE